MPETIKPGTYTLLRGDDTKRYPEFMVRAEARRYSVVVDAEAERFGTSGPRLELYYFRVLRLTPCGVWIDVWGTERFVLLGATKKWACKTTDEALASLVARKRRQVSILTRQLREAEEDRDLASTALLAALG